VRYLDPDGDAPTFVRINISNETDGVHDMVGQGSGPRDYTQPVAFVVERAADERQAQLFVHRVGRAWSTSTPASGNFQRLSPRSRQHHPFTFVALYVGQGNISYSPRPQLLGPPALAPSTASSQDSAKRHPLPIHQHQF